MVLTNDKQFQMRVSADFLSMIDNWRRSQPDIPGRAEAVRRLVESGIGGQAAPIIPSDEKGLEQLFREFLNAGGKERLESWGYCDGGPKTVDEAIETEFRPTDRRGKPCAPQDGFGQLQHSARSLLSLIEDEKDAPAVALRNLLNRLTT